MERTIELADLSAFVREFTEEHRSQPMSLEILVGTIWNIQETGLPLVGLDLETKGSNGPALEILLGDVGSGTKRHLTHTVHGVTALTVELDENERERRLVVKGDNGSQAVLSID